MTAFASWVHGASDAAHRAQACGARTLGKAPRSRADLHRRPDPGADPRRRGRGELCAEQATIASTLRLDGQGVPLNRYPQCLTDPVAEDSLKEIASRELAGRSSSTMRRSDQGSGKTFGERAAARSNFQTRSRSGVNVGPCRSW